MNLIERKKFKSLCKQLVIQGDHKSEITKAFSVITESANKEFREDNNTTLRFFLKGCFDEALDEVLPTPLFSGT